MIRSKYIAYFCILLGCFTLLFYYPFPSTPNQEIVYPNEIVSDSLDTISFELYSSIGILSIPTLSLETSIVEGSDAVSLDIGVGHVVGSGYTKGNTVLAAHRATYFKQLDQLVIGDSISIMDCTGTNYEYVVYEIFEVYPKDIWVLEDIGEDIVTLITCTDHNRKRLIVRGRFREGMC